MAAIVADDNNVRRHAVHLGMSRGAKWGDLRESRGHDVKAARSDAGRTRG
jgi:hypothetical protein